MPPKKANQPAKKAIEKQKQKIIEDKTFGIKNKKGGKQQKFIEQVQKQVTEGNKTAKQLEKVKKDKEDKKEQKKKEIEELQALFKPVFDSQKLAKGVDPKSVLCAYFKKGLCTKGNKCRFSHDLEVERKAEKRNIYELQEEKDDMSKWDQAKLEEVIYKRHGVKNNGLPPTTIICKFFIDAVEGNKYGWFWECNNGPKCHYRHALPQDYILKRDQKKLLDQKEEISIEELIENERAALGPNQTKVCLETFMAWKRKKRSEKVAKFTEERTNKEKDFKQGKQTGLSGKELFEFNPELKTDRHGDDADDENVFVRENGAANDDEEESGPVHEIRIEDFYGEMNGDSAQGACGGPAVIDEELFNADDLEGIDEEFDDLELES